MIDLWLLFVYTHSGEGGREGKRALPLKLMILK